MLHFYIGNKNYSSWSMRRWVMLRQAGISFTAVMVRLDSLALARSAYAEGRSRFPALLRQACRRIG